MLVANWMTSRVLPATEPLLTQTLDCAGAFSASFIDDTATDGLIILQVRGSTNTFYCGVSQGQHRHVLLRGESGQHRHVLLPGVIAEVDRGTL